MLDIDTITHWLPWIPLEGCWKNSRVSSETGLYRLRLIGQEHFDYVGQSGVTLPNRLSKLASIYGDQMPYGDPHVAAPALWAIRKATGNEFEVSVAPVAGDTSWRKALKAVLVTNHRLTFSRSPTASFGKMPPGYSKSSSASKRMRGGPTDAGYDYHLPGVPLTGPLHDNLQSLNWCGHSWSRWIAFDPAAFPAAASVGLYRLRDADKPDLLYVGQGFVAARLKSHGQKARNPNDAQGTIFASAKRLECSWVLADTWKQHHLLELENDLIASHVLQNGAAPPAQFMGRQDS